MPRQRQSVHPPLSGSLINVFIKEYVQRVRDLRQVRQVLLDESSGVPEIWTLIEATPFERVERDLVYQAELDTLVAHPETQTNFHVINLAEHANTPPAHILPSQAKTHFAR